MLTIYESSIYPRPARDNVEKYVGIPNCLNITSTSNKSYFQYAGVPLTELINENALSLATNILILHLKLFLIAPAESVLGLILCIAKFIDECEWCYSYTELAKNIYSASDAKC